ncbi:hypothetical protein U9M48_021062 [Paspalum notatum var. saurae]|uniref:Uncharacterized protein n=1 Tax=Paspalum notatum var. saurae TaxID=547442 RepID=A0AAQ3TIB2_PASNO
MALLLARNRLRERERENVLLKCGTELLLDGIYILDDRSIDDWQRKQAGLTHAEIHASQARVHSAQEKQIDQQATLAAALGCHRQACEEDLHWLAYVSRSACMRGHLLAPAGDATTRRTRDATVHRQASRHRQRQRGWKAYVFGPCALRLPTHSLIAFEALNAQPFGATPRRARAHVLRWWWWWWCHAVPLQSRCPSAHACRECPPPPRGGPAVALEGTAVEGILAISSRPALLNILPPKNITSPRKRKRRAARAESETQSARPASSSRPVVRPSVAFPSHPTRILARRRSTCPEASQSPPAPAPETRMTRRCSHCSNNGHNARTCPARSAAGGGVKLFGVRLTTAPAPAVMKKSASMSCIASSLGGGSGGASPPGVGAGRGGGGGGGAGGYVSDDPAHASCSTNGRAERKKGMQTLMKQFILNGNNSIELTGEYCSMSMYGTPWTEEEHRMFLMGLQKLGKGDWRGISRNFVVSRTPTQVASHAQKYFIRQTNSSRRKRRSSLFDMVPEMPMDESPAAAEQFTLQNTQDEDISSDQLPTLHLGQQNETEIAKQLPPFQLRQHEESEYEDQSVQFEAITDPIGPAFYPSLHPVPLTLWPPTPSVSHVEEAGTAHEILKPTPLNVKGVVKADDVVGMSKLSIGDASSGSMEPTALSLQLIGSTDTRQSAFHVRPPMNRPELSKRNGSPIHAV